MRPSDVGPGVEKRLLRSVYRETKKVGRSRFKVGDPVRISKYKHLFEKSYTPNWTTEVFTIDRKRATNPRTYLLRDTTGQQVKGGFYGEELQKNKYPGVFLVEQVLRRKGNQEFVKWLGFDKSHNSWIDVE